MRPKFSESIPDDHRNHWHTRRRQDPVRHHKTDSAAGQYLYFPMKGEDGVTTMHPRTVYTNINGLLLDHELIDGGDNQEACATGGRWASPAQSSSLTKCSCTSGSHAVKPRCRKISRCWRRLPPRRGLHFDHPKRDAAGPQHSSSRRPPSSR